MSPSRVPRQIPARGDQRLAPRRAAAAPVRGERGRRLGRRGRSDRGGRREREVVQRPVTHSERPPGTTWPGRVFRAHSTSPAVAPPQDFTDEPRTANPPLDCASSSSVRTAGRLECGGKRLKQRRAARRAPRHAAGRQLDAARSGRIAGGAAPGGPGGAAARSRSGGRRGAVGSGAGDAGGAASPTTQHRHHGHHAEQQDGPHGQDHQLLHGESFSFPASTRPRRASFS